MKSLQAGVLPGLAAVVLLQGCATIFTGTHDTLRFDANVPGVRLTLDGMYQGELPLTIDMSRNFMGGRRFLARFEREGYVTQEFQLNRDFNAVSILDISSPITSGGVDVLTGSIMKFSPRDYHVQMLEKSDSASSQAFRRSLELYRFALTNHARLQEDIARGAGSHLETFAWLVGNGDEAAARLVSAAILDHSAALLPAPTAPEFVRQFDRMLAEDALLRTYRLN
ncbi:MAG: hypothetical protein E6J62_18325 [Deltaproteobacteria bacterium]|nr:MAG: hypothetical protein E6J62_18325 [Deltaproteobacteria bacterium]TMB30373.1 MAG: hypothetical protein E6J61_12885 [Deltaproteobacteria bacterium]